MYTLRLFLIICLFVKCQPTLNVGYDFSAMVIGIKDGDTIDVLYLGTPITIRLAHIDCPEIRKHQPYGMVAKKYVSKLCFNRQVTIVNVGEYDRNNRLIAEIIDEKGININQELVRSGLAWHFKRYSNDSVYSKLEEEARASRIGLWQDENPVPPWNWRKSFVK